MDDGRRVVLAAVAGAHGVRGEVRLRLFAESLDSLKRHQSFDARGHALTLRAVRDGPHGPIARFVEIADRTAAEALAGAELSVPRSALSPPGEGETYVADLVGLPALADGVEVGRVVGVQNYGAGDLIEIEAPDGGRRLIPFARCREADGALTLDAAFLA